MRVLVKVLAGVIIVILLLVSSCVLIGWQLPVAHTASRSIVLHQPSSSVYARVRDFGSVPSWNSDLKSVVVEKQTNGRIHFRETGKNGTVNYELVEDVPGEKIVTRILDNNLGYSGKWTYKFAPEGGGGTRISITEDGEISNIIFRFASKYVFGQTATMDSYLTALAHRFGENSTVQ
jgi:uncharacterized membrane protein